MSTLNSKQQAFVAEYLIDLNATQAAIRAGYSAKTAHSCGPRLLENADVDAAIKAGKLARAKRTGIDADWVLKRLAEEADADIADLYHAGTNDLLPVDQWPLIWRKGLVTGIDIDALYEGAGADRVQIGETKKVRLSERIKRVELIGKHVTVNAFQEFVQHKGLEGLAARLDAAAALDD